MLVDFFNDLGFSEVDTPHVSYLALLSCCQIPICTITPMFLSPRSKQSPRKVRDLAGKINNLIIGEPYPVYAISSSNNDTELITRRHIDSVGNVQTLS